MVLDRPEIPLHTNGSKTTFVVTSPGASSAVAHAVISAGTAATPSLASPEHAPNSKSYSRTTCSDRLFVPGAQAIPHLLEIILVRPTRRDRHKFCPSYKFECCESSQRKTRLGRPWEDGRASAYSRLPNDRGLTGVLWERSAILLCFPRTAAVFIALAIGVHIRRYTRVACELRHRTGTLGHRTCRVCCIPRRTLNRQHWRESDDPAVGRHPHLTAPSLPGDECFG
jgi:hypothetical protein